MEADLELTRQKVIPQIIRKEFIIHKSTPLASVPPVLPPAPVTRVM